MSVSRLFSQVWFIVPTIKQSECQAKAGGKVYTYYFTPESPDPVMKCGHAIELSTVFKHPELSEDTGRLFDSIDADVSRDSQNAFTVSVGANTPYAVYVHEGTYKLKGRAFITDAVMGKKNEVQSILAGELPKGIT